MSAAANRSRRTPARGGDPTEETTPAARPARGRPPAATATVNRGRQRAGPARTGSRSAGEESGSPPQRDDAAEPEPPAPPTDAPGPEPAPPAAAADPAPAAPAPPVNAGPAAHPAAPAPAPGEARDAAALSPNRITQDDLSPQRAARENDAELRALTDVLRRAECVEALPYLQESHLSSVPRLARVAGGVAALQPTGGAEFRRAAVHVLEAMIRYGGLELADEAARTLWRKRCVIILEEVQRERAAGAGAARRTLDLIDGDGARTTTHSPRGIEADRADLDLAARTINAQYRGFGPSAGAAPLGADVLAMADELRRSPPCLAGLHKLTLRGQLGGAPTGTGLRHKPSSTMKHRRGVSSSDELSTLEAYMLVVSYAGAIVLVPHGYPHDPLDEGSGVRWGTFGDAADPGDDPDAEARLMVKAVHVARIMSEVRRTVTDARLDAETTRRYVDLFLREVGDIIGRGDRTVTAAVDAVYRQRLEMVLSRNRYVISQRRGDGAVSDSDSSDESDGSSRRSPRAPATPRARGRPKSRDSHGRGGKRRSRDTDRGSRGAGKEKRARRASDTNVCFKWAKNRYGNGPACKKSCPNGYEHRLPRDMTEAEAKRMFG